MKRYYHYEDIRVSTKTFCDNCKNELYNPIKPPIEGSKIYGNRKVTFSVGITYSAELDLCNSCLAKALGEVVQEISNPVQAKVPASNVIDMSAVK